MLYMTKHSNNDNNNNNLYFLQHIVKSSYPMASMSKLWYTEEETNVVQHPCEHLHDILQM